MATTIHKPAPAMPKKTAMSANSASSNNTASKKAIIPLTPTTASASNSTPKKAIIPLPPSSVNTSAPKKTATTADPVSSVHSTPKKAALTSIPSPSSNSTLKKTGVTPNTASSFSSMPTQSNANSNSMSRSTPMKSAMKSQSATSGKETPQSTTLASDSPQRATSTPITPGSTVNPTPLSTAAPSTGTPPVLRSMNALLALLSYQGALSSPFSQPNGRCKGEGIATQVFPRIDKLLPGEPVTLDIEHVNFSRKSRSGRLRRLGWIAIVNTRGEVILDCFVNYEHEDDVRIDHNTPEHLKIAKERLWYRNGAVNSYVVEEWVRLILKDRPVILWDETNDRRAFQHCDPFAAASSVIDAQRYYSTSGKKVALKTQTLQDLNLVIQVGEHSPVEDSLATLILHSRAVPNFYDRPSEFAKFQALSDSEKSKYFASGPVVLGEHYQNNRDAFLESKAVHDCARKASRGGGPSRSGQVYRGGQASSGGRGGRISSSGGVSRGGPSINASSGGRGGRGGSASRGGGTGSGRGNQPQNAINNIYVKNLQGAGNIGNNNKTTATSTRGGASSRGRSTGNRS